MQGRRCCSLLFIILNVGFVAYAQQGASVEDPPWVKEVGPKPLVYSIPGMDKVTVERDIV